MKKEIVKYVVLIVAIIYIAKITNTCLEQAREIRIIRDTQTTILIQKDSLQKVFEVSESQFKKLILSQDSMFKEIIKEKDIKIKNLNSISKIHIRDTIVTPAEPIIKEVPVHKDTIISFSQPMKIVKIEGTLTIKDHAISLEVNKAILDITIVAIDYYDVIHWYNFKKRKEHGYSLIGFRKHYKSKVYAKCKETNQLLPIELIKIKK